MFLCVHYDIGGLIENVYSTANPCYDIFEHVYPPSTCSSYFLFFQKLLAFVKLKYLQHV